MGLPGGGLMGSSPEGPCDDARWLDALLLKLKPNFRGVFKLRD
jgi:hypothetical protein